LSEYISYLKWAEMLDVEADDALLVSSNIQRAVLAAAKNREDFSPSLFIESLCAKLGEKGTLVFPTFNWGFCRGKTFDYARTPCMTGALGRAALKMSGFKRTRHPIYSFAVWGRDRDFLCETENVSSFGSDSPFAYLHEKGKNLIIDVPMRDCFTFAHYVEEQVGVEYRYMKTFTAPYIGGDGTVSTRSYSMLVRDLEKNAETLIDPIGEDMVRIGTKRDTRINDIPFSALRFSDFFDLARVDILENRARKLCRYDGQERQTV
jgi:aminoglycoside 3-N-acetyltransferase